MRPATHDLNEFLLAREKVTHIEQNLYTMFRLLSVKNSIKDIIRLIQYMVHAARRAHRRRTSATPYSRPYQRVPSYADVVHTAGQPHLGRRTSCWNDADVPVPHPASSWHCPYSCDDDAVTCDAS